MKKYNKLLGSSVNPEKLSLTIRGVIRMIIPVAMSLAPFFSIEPVLLEDLFGSLEGLLNSLDTLVASVFGAWAAFEIVIGGVRKLAVVLGLVKVN